MAILSYPMVTLVQNRLAKRDRPKMNRWGTSDLRSTDGATPRSKPFEFGRAWLVAAWRLICGLEFEGFKYQFLLGVSGLANLHTCAERCRMLASEGSGQEKEPPRRERDPFAQRVEVGWWDGSVNPVVKASFPK